MIKNGKVVINDEKRIMNKDVSNSTGIRNVSISVSPSLCVSFLSILLV